MRTLFFQCLSAAISWITHHYKNEYFIIAMYFFSKMKDRVKIFAFLFYLTIIQPFRPKKIDCYESKNWNPRQVLGYAVNFS